ncbi:hypothetical protein NONI108955_23955 [Nocardia ninae]
MRDGELAPPLCPVRSLDPVRPGEQRPLLPDLDVRQTTVAEWRTIAESSHRRRGGASDGHYQEER